MGLDQYASARRGEPVKNEDGHLEYPEKVEIAYWRKHPNLQGWMENLWESKGRPGLTCENSGNMLGDFNCIPVELTIEDLDNLETAINGGELPSKSGFFFGNDSDEHYREQDLKFIQEARRYIEDGYTVEYSSWW
jgi:hypothetical protein